MNKKNVLISLVLIGFISCFSKKGMVDNAKISGNEIFTIKSDCNFIEGQGMDSKVGSIQCGDVLMDYDFGKYAYAGPVTIEEGFLKAFNANYYTKFFEIIHIEAKLNRMFRDSVRLINVTDIGDGSKLLFNCNVCTKVANLSFRNRRYAYPFQPQSEDPHLKSYEISLDTTATQIRKIFLSKLDSLPSGLYLKPIPNNKSSNNLSVVTRSRVELQNLKKLLESVELK